MREYILRTDLGYYTLEDSRDGMFCERLDNRLDTSFLDDEEEDIEGESFSGYVESILKNVSGKKFRRPITRFSDTRVDNYFKEIEFKWENIRYDTLLRFSGMNETIGLIKYVYQKI